jgi:integrase/recombinase XerC
MQDMGIELFYKYLKLEKRYSEHTIRAYIDDINQFYAYHKELDPEFDFIQNPDYRQIRSWIVNLSQTGHSARTINRKLSSLKKYTKYEISEGNLEKNPFEKILSLKVHRKLPSFLNTDETNALLDAGLFEEDFKGKRDRAIIELLYCTGIRLSELLNIKSRDFDYRTNNIKVLGKRNKERIIPFPQSLVKIVKDYEEEKLRIGLENDYLFTTEKGKKCYARLIERIVKQYLSQITTNEKKNPHMLRHSYATHMLNNGADINAIKELLGHSNLSATQIYTHNTFERINKIYKQAHPRA